MIRKFKMKNLRNSEFLQFHSQNLAHVLNAGPEQLGLNDEYNALEQVCRSMENVYGKQKGSALTKKLKEADRRRDRLVIGSRKYFESFTYHDDPAKVAAGKSLVKCMDRYGKNIARMNYFEESAIITRMTEEWEEDQTLGEAIDLLNGGEWKDALKEANEHFDELYLQRINDYTNTPKESVISLKDPVAKAYEELVNHLEAHTTLAKDKTPYNDLIKVLNRNIKTFELLLKKRSNSETEVSAEEVGPDDGDS